MKIYEIIDNNMGFLNNFFQISFRCLEKIIYTSFLLIRFVSDKGFEIIRLLYRTLSRSTGLATKVELAHLDQRLSADFNHTYSVAINHEELIVLIRTIIEQLRLYPGAQTMFFRVF